MVRLRVLHGVRQWPPPELPLAAWRRGQRVSARIRLSADETHRLTGSRA